MMDELNYDMGALALNPFSFKLCSWNINGSAKAEYRKEVLSKTFEKVLLPCEIICLQEVPFNPSRDSSQRKMKEYIPQLADSFGVIHVRETAGGGIYNAVLFDERKFKDCSTETSFKDAIEKAYQLMEKKCEIYRSLSSLDDDRRTAQLSTYLSMQNSLEYEVAIECNECGGFKKALKRYSKKDDMPGFIRSPKDILQGRIAFSLLKASGIACNHLIVLSVHALNQEAVDFAYLLFDFLGKFGFDYPMLIAGDFNCHITKIPYVGRFLKDYDIPHYELRPLRGGARIDFIMKKCREPRNVVMTNLSAHDFILPDVGTQEANAAISIEMQRTYTNHSPLTVKVTVN